MTTASKRDQWANRMTIKSETSSREYTIAQRINVEVPESDWLWECSCPGWKAYRRCKHLKAMGLQTQAPITPRAKGEGISDNWTFTDDAYIHYDPSREGYGSWQDWSDLAERMIRGRGRYQYRGWKPRVGDSKSADMKLLDLTEMPATVKGLLKAMRKRAMIDHPDHGGTNEAFRNMWDAYQRLVKMY